MQVLDTDSLIDGPHRGYDRAKLVTQLEELRDAAKAVGAQGKNGEGAP
jgi:hypothetical protein